MYNEEAGIRENTEALLSSLRSLDVAWELIVVDDGSTDGSRKIVEEIASSEQGLRLLGYPRNRGRGYALRTGFREARGRYIVTTESDLSWGPDIAEKLYRSLLENDYDVVIASPFVKGGRHENVPMQRRFLSRFGNKILKLAVHGKLTMLSGMTRGYRAEVIRSLDLRSDRKEIHLEIISKCLDLGCRVGEIPAVLRWSTLEHGAGSRSSSFNAKKLILSHLAFAFYESPIILIGSTAIGLFVCGSAIGIYLAYLSLIKGVPVSGRPLLIYMLLFVLVGLITLIFCFLANQNRHVRKQLTIISTRLGRIENESRPDDER